MYTSILIATDLSRDSDELVRCAAGLAGLGCRRAHLVYGLEMDDIGGLRSSIEELVGTEIERQKATLRHAGIEPFGHVAMRPVKEGIERLAQENDCSLLVVGSQVRSLAGEIVAGGIAGALLTSARRPLLVLRLHQADESAPPTCSSWPCTPLRHLLHPTDFSENAARALEYVQRLVAGFSPERVTLMHVQEERRIEPHLKDRIEEFNATDRNRLERLRRSLAGAGAPPVDIELSYGHPAREIAGFCRREAVSLVVMGTQGRGYLGELLLGSVSHSVARQAPVPVLLVPFAWEPPEQGGSESARHNICGLAEGSHARIATKRLP